MYIHTNPNPAGKEVGDCVIRAIAILFNLTWLEAYDAIVEEGRLEYDMPSANEVWPNFLFRNGFRRHIITNTCPNCYTVRDFCRDNPIGEYLLATGSHVIAVIDGNYYDAWDSGNKVPIYYFKRERSY